MYRIACLLSIVLSINGCVNKGDELTALAIMKIDSTKYEEAIPLLLQAIELENALAQFELGKLYEEGTGVEIDLEKSTELYIASAALGHGKAQLKCGESFMMGQGVEQDRVLGLKYLEDCAAQDVLKCKLRLLMAYRNGIGVEVDNEKALEFGAYIASQKPNRDSLENQIILTSRVNMSRIYLFGDGVAKDTVESYKWALIYNEDKKLVSSKGQGNMLTNIKLYVDDMTDDQKAEARSRAELAIGTQLQNADNLFIIESQPESGTE